MFQRLYSITCLVAALLLPGISHADSLKQFFPGRLYVTLENSNAIEVLPSGQVWSGIKGAHYDAISANGRYLLVTSDTPGQVYILNAHTGKKLAVLPLGSTHTQGVKVSPDNEWALAVEPDRDSVAVIDLKHRKIAKTIMVGKTPHNVRFNHSGSIAYVTLQGGTGVAVVNMKSLTKVDEIPVPKLHGPHNLDLSDHGRLLWVRDIQGQVAVVDLKTRKVLHYITVGHGHAGIDVIPGGRYVFTGAIADHVVDVIDPKTYEVIKSIDVGVGPHGVRASRDGRWLYTEVVATNKIAVIDTRSLKVVKQIPTHGEVPFWGAVLGNR